MGYSTLRQLKSVIYPKAGLFVVIITVLSILGGGLCSGQNKASSNTRNADGWPISIYQSKKVASEKKIDLGKIYVKKPQKDRKTGLVNEKNVEKSLSNLREEKKQLEKMLKKLDRESRRLRYKARLKKKRRCA